MAKGILGKKVGMTQIFTKDGKVVPVTVVEASPNLVAQVKSVESDGYKSGLALLKIRKLPNRKKDILPKQISSRFDSSENCVWLTRRSKSLETRLPSISSPKAKSSMLSEHLKAKALPARSNGTISRVDQWRTVPNRTESRARWVRGSAAAAAKFSKARSFPAVWVASG